MVSMRIKMRWLAPPLSLLLLVVVLQQANCAKDIPAAAVVPADDDDPAGFINCGELSRTWHGLCIKHGTCNRPCREEGYDAGYCATWPFLHACCCTNNCPGSAAGRRRPSSSSFLPHPLHKDSIQCG